MKIFFIRHGETTGDVENRYGGAYDDHLSEKGREQSKRVALTLKPKGVEKIFASTLFRAQETARAIAAETGASIEPRDAIKERDQYGILTGMKKDEAKATHPELVEAVKDRLNTLDGAESYEDMSRRVMKGFDDILNSGYKTVAVVTHGGPLRVLFRDYLKWGELKEIGDCSFVEFEVCGKDFSYLSSEGLGFDFVPKKA